MSAREIESVGAFESANTYMCSRGYARIMRRVRVRDILRAGAKVGQGRASAR